MKHDDSWPHEGVGLREILRRFPTSTAPDSLHHIPDHEQESRNPEHHPCDLDPPTATKQIVNPISGIRFRLTDFLHFHEHHPKGRIACATPSARVPPAWFTTESRYVFNMHTTHVKHVGSQNFPGVQVARKPPPQDLLSGARITSVPSTCLTFPQYVPVFLDTVPS